MSLADPPPRPDAPTRGAFEALVGQFASPWAFLRELVQNGMDAGSGALEVRLDWIPDPQAPAGEGLASLTVRDDGEGMDEGRIDRALLELFSSTKRGDRTQAGGFGVGFVSVFAWRPALVVVQTGRGGEAWELWMWPDGEVDKHRLEHPYEGTCVTLLRPASRDELEGLAGQIRATLWAWCRFCPAQLEFEDRAAGLAPEPIRARPGSARDVIARRLESGRATIHVGLGAPGEVVLLRRGIVLAEGGPALLGAVAARDPGLFARASVWLDSDALTTTLTRDHVVADAQSAPLFERAARALEELWTELLARAVTRAAEPAPWGRDELATHGADLATLWATATTPQRSATLRSARVLRTAWPAGSTSVQALVAAHRAEPIGLCDPSWADRHAEAWAGRSTLVVVDLDTDRGWLEAIAQAGPIRWAETPTRAIQIRAPQPVGPPEQALLTATAAALTRAGLGLSGLWPCVPVSPEDVDRLCALDPLGPPGERASWAWAEPRLPLDAWRGRDLAVHVRHPLVSGAAVLAEHAPELAGALLAAALLDLVCETPPDAALDRALAGGAS